MFQNFLFGQAVADFNGSFYLSRFGFSQSMLLANFFIAGAVQSHQPVKGMQQALPHHHGAFPRHPHAQNDRQQFRGRSFWSRS